MVLEVLAGVVTLGAIMFGIPAAIGFVRLTRKGREAARRARAAARASQQQEVIQERQRVEQFWRQHPGLAGMAETLAYQVRRAANQHAVDELARRHQELAEHVEHRRQTVHGGKPATAGYRIIVLAGLTLFLVVFALGLTLDFLIFRGLHPVDPLGCPSGWPAWRLPASPRDRQ